jgi:hypothetical protein
VIRKPAAVFMLLAGMSLGAAAAWAGPLKLTLSGSAGMFTPSGRTYQHLYGAGIPLSLDAWLTFGSRFGAAAGLNFLSDSGTAVAVNGGEDDYPLKIVRLTIPVSLYYAARLGRNVDLRFGVGAGLHRYREEWTSLSLVTRGWKVSPRLCASASWRAIPSLPRLAFVGTLDCDFVRIGSGALLSDKTEIGGFEFLVGASWRFF